MLDIYELSYNDVLSLPRIYIDEVKEFKKNLESVNDVVFDVNKKLGQMILESEDLSLDSISTCVFAGEIVKYYPNLKYSKVLTTFTCPFSGEIVSKGSEQVVWKPLLWLPKRRESYVLSKYIRASYYYDCMFPTTLEEFNDFYFKVNNAYELDIDDYYDFATNIGGSLVLRKLKK